jgi:putative redox protein
MTPQAAPGTIDYDPLKRRKRLGQLMSMTATARRTGNSLMHEVNVNGRHTIVTDEPERLGGSDEGPAPHELLAATLASCTATMIAMYAQNRGWDIGETAVDVDYDAETVPRRFTIDIHLPEDLTSEQQRRLERVAETCPVRKALEAGFCFEERTTATRAPIAVAGVA